MQSDAIGRYNSFRYHDLTHVKLREFGTYHMRYCMLHRVGDVFVFSLAGNRIIEIHPNDDCFLIIPPSTSLGGLCSRWADLSPNCYFAYVTRKRVTGLNEYDITRHEYNRSSRPPGGSKLTGECTTTGRFKFGLDGTLSVAGVPQKVAVQDRVKYREFNKQLRDLRAVLYTQIRMDAKKPTETRGQQQQNINKLLNAVFGVPNMYNEEAAYKVVSTWMEKQDPKVASYIAALAFSRCHTHTPGNEGMIKQVSNILVRAQRYFLQEHCVTIQEATPGSDNDQDGELLTTDGLREM